MQRFQSQDVVRVISGQGKGKTGVVNRQPEGHETVNVFITQDNPSGLGIWYQASELKKIGSTKRKVRP